MSKNRHTSDISISSTENPWTKKLNITEKNKPVKDEIISILTSEYNPPTFPINKHWFKKSLTQFYQKNNISNVFLYNKRCNHFYRVKTSDNFYHFKKQKTPEYKKEKCLVCEKLKQTPTLSLPNRSSETFKSMALLLINEYERLLRSKKDYSEYDYNIYDCEICFYIWLYIDFFH